MYPRQLKDTIHYNRGDGAYYDQTLTTSFFSWYSWTRMDCVFRHLVCLHEHISFKGMGFAIVFQRNMQLVLLQIWRIASDHLILLLHRVKDTSTLYIYTRLWSRSSFFFFAPLSLLFHSLLRVIRGNLLVRQKIDITVDDRRPFRSQWSKLKCKISMQYFEKCGLVNAPCFRFRLHEGNRGRRRAYLWKLGRFVATM